MDKMELYSIPTLCLVKSSEDNDDQSIGTEDAINNIQSVGNENKTKTNGKQRDIVYEKTLEMDEDTETSLVGNDLQLKYESLQHCQTEQRKIIYLEMMKIKGGNRDQQHAKFLKLSSLLIELSKATCIMDIEQLMKRTEKSNLQK